MRRGEAVELERAFHIPDRTAEAKQRESEAPLCRMRQNDRVVAPPPFATCFPQGRAIQACAYCTSGATTALRA
jgi:hypothetical protein